MGIKIKCRFATHEIPTYFTSFRLFTHTGVNNIWATVVFNKNELSRCVNVATLNSAHQAKKAVQCNHDSGWLERQHCILHNFF